MHPQDGWGWHIMDPCRHHGIVDEGSLRRWHGINVLGLGEGEGNADGNADGKGEGEREQVIREFTFYRTS